MMDRIVEKEAPNLPQGNYSEEFRDFISKR